ncbi:Bulb-type lectin domain [Sesbania bispinosa]|nr:Bulb-type lectin domain [Sesbania bispinosa]
MASLTFLILTLVFLHVFLAFANVNLSSTLSTNDNHAWLSPSGEFAFGFRQLSGTSHFTVAIWYDKIPDKTIVWNAKANDNIAEAPTGSQVHLTSEGLILTSPEKVTIWMARPGGVVSFGAMLDTGNFVLANRESTFVWESFKNPTDTLLPNQSLSLDGKLTSRITETNYTRGRFQLYFQDGSVFLCSLGWPSQFRYDPYYAFDASGSSSKLVFNNSGDIYIERTDGTRVQPHGAKWDTNVILDPMEYYYRATLDFHGVFTQYSHPRGSTSQPGWEIVRYVPNDICAAINRTLGSGPCWYNSYCSMKSDRPTCECPYGYSLVDPSNEFGGCQPKFTLGCGADTEGLQGRPEELYELHESSDRDFMFAEYDIIQPYSLSECKQSCLQDCMCAAASFSNNGCYKKRLPLINGKIGPLTYLIFTKTRDHPLTSSNKGLPTLPDSREEDQAKPILLGTLIGSLVVNSILLVTVVLVLLFKPKRIVQVASLLETKLHSFTYEDSGEEEKAILTDWAYDCYMEGRIDALLDDDDKGAMDDYDKLQRWVKIAIWCIQEHHEIRPTMGMVMQMLEGSVEVPNPPPPYSFS